MLNSAIAKEEYIKRSSRFGVRGEHRHVVIPADQVARITQLGNWEPARLQLASQWTITTWW